MLNALRQHWRRWRADMPVQDGIVFIHHRPARGNVGDLLCSPRHYFRFTGAQPGLVVMGGGVWVELGLRHLRKMGYAPAATVLWGAGQSLPADQALEPVAELPYLHWGLRDRDGVVSERHFLPCVSCLHPMLDVPVPATGSTLLLLNADSAVTTPAELQAIAALSAARGWTLLGNNCSPAQMAAALAQSRQIVTNSFHGAYWGLLAGRSVALLGYSSKFRSLLQTLALDPQRLLPVGRGAGDLHGALAALDVAAASQQLADPAASRADLRQRQHGFVAQLVQCGAIASARALTPDQ